MTPLRANPGGNLPANQAVGRAALCETCWTTLETQSIRLENERRLGKTTVLRLLDATKPPKTRTITMEVGGLSSTTDFIDELILEIDKAVPEKGKGFMTRARNLVGGLAGFEIAGLLRIPDNAKTHWRRILLGCFEALADATPDRIVFFWDELPWMLQRIKKEEGSARVVDLLNTLRDIRQGHDRIRMVYTGSIGFHHVVSAIEEEGVGSRPISDMRRINVPPLEKHDAIELAERLLLGEKLKADAPSATAAALYEVTGGVPYYIHCIVADMRQGAPASPERVRQIAADALLDANDPWEMRYFNSRLDLHYGGDAPLARIVLDTIADADSPRGFSTLHQAVRAKGQSAGDLDEHGMRRLLTKLMQDHYLEREPGNAEAFRFKFTLVRDSWRIQRGLGK